MNFTLQVKGPGMKLDQHSWICFTMLDVTEAR